MGAGRSRRVLVAILVLGAVVLTGASEAGAGDLLGEPPAPALEPEGDAADVLEQVEQEAGAHGSAGDACPPRLAELGVCKPHVHDSGDDFRPFTGGAARDDRHSHGDTTHTHDPHRRNPAFERDAPGRRDATGRTLGRTTLEQTIEGGGDPKQGFQTLKLAAGEPRIVREELAKAKKGRAKRRRSLLYVAQTTDWQLVDEESPARVEFLDIAANPPFPSTVSAAWRPQEAFGPFAVEQSIRQLNEFADASPVRQGNGRRARMAMALMTGDQADNQQLNETQWVLRLLEGGAIDPNSGTDPSACAPGQRPSGQTADPALYAGVQDFDDYAEGQQFYDPDQPAGPKYGDWPTYPGLMDRAQLGFDAVGLDVPTYVVFGNHDALAQGNQKAIQPFEAVGVGCVKPLVPVGDLTEVADVLDPGYLAGLAQTNPSQVMLVPPDERRRYVDKRQYKQIFLDAQQDDGYGFDFVDAAELEASDGAAAYYSWKPKPGIRMIGIDTLCEGGVTGPSSNGNIDHPQFRWLEAELEAASERDELIIVFGHHPIRSLSCDAPDETPPACTVDDQHGHDVNPGCDLDPRASTPVHLGDDLTELFHRFPHVIAYVAGHTHENSLTKFDREGGGPGDFWGIETASLVDWPPQNRLVELMNNCDGTLSIFGTTLDTAAPATASPSGTAATGLGGEDLASISRTLAYNDPQAGAGTGEGEPNDRNVELLLEDPRSDPPPCRSKADGPDRDPDGGGGGNGQGGDAGDVEPTPSAGLGSLPFTGLVLGTLLLVAIGLLLSGGTVRRLGLGARGGAERKAGRSS